MSDGRVDDNQASGGRVVRAGLAGSGEAYPVDLTWIHPFTGVVTRARFDVALRDGGGSGGGRGAAELTVKVALRPGAGVTGGQVEAAWAGVRAGVSEAFNEP